MPARNRRAEARWRRRAAAKRRRRHHVELPAEYPAGDGYPPMSGTGTISSPRSLMGIAGTGTDGERGGDGGVIPGHTGT